MRNLLIPFAALAIAACASTASNAPTANFDPDTPRYNGFEGTLAPIADRSVALDVRLSESLLYLADNRGDFRGSRGLRDGFGSGGYLGDKDLMELVEETEDELVEELTKRGINVVPNANTILRVTLVDAQPNRPTFNQLSSQPSLSYQSYGDGGISVEGELIRAGGQPLGTFTYGYYTRFTEESAFRGTWTDAYRGLSRMANTTAKRLTG